MKMESDRIDLSKIHKRRDRYEIPDWQREEVWDDAKKRRLIDSILRGWKLPKFYFAKADADGFEVVDGQQRLQAIWQFFENDLELDAEAAARHGGTTYRELPAKASDAFDDFDIEFDVIIDGTDDDLKEFFQRLQLGMQLNSSEKLNSINSKLRNFCLERSKHRFFQRYIGVNNKRYAHFDIMAKAAAVEVDGLGSGLRFADVEKVFKNNSQFSATSGPAKRIDDALELLAKAFRTRPTLLRSRAVVQTVINAACQLITLSSMKRTELQEAIGAGVEAFLDALRTEVERGALATNSDLLAFQSTINANTRGAARTRHEILVRWLLIHYPKLSLSLGSATLAQCGPQARIKELATSIARLIETVNEQYAAVHGDDLFKATNRTVGALQALSKVATDEGEFGSLIDDLYFLLREGPGQRLSGNTPRTFSDLNDIRTLFRHDVDHGKAKDVRQKRKRTSDAFAKYAQVGTLGEVDVARWPFIQCAVLQAAESGLIEVSRSSSLFQVGATGGSAQV